MFLCKNDKVGTLAEQESGISCRARSGIFRRAKKWKVEFLAKQEVEGGSSRGARGGKATSGGELSPKGTEGEGGGFGTQRSFAPGFRLNFAFSFHHFVVPLPPGGRLMRRVRRGNTLQKAIPSTRVCAIFSRLIRQPMADTKVRRA